MDILISSNLERLIYLSTGSNAVKTSKLMEQLGAQGHYEVTADMSERLKDFLGGYATEEVNAAAIRKLFEDTGYLIDTHTGVAAAVYVDYIKKTGDRTPTVIASTASPYKFSRSVVEAVCNQLKGEDEFAIIDELHQLSGVPEPKAVQEIRNAEIRHNLECDTDKMKEIVADILGLSDK